MQSFIRAADHAVIQDSEERGLPGWTGRALLVGTVLAAFLLAGIAVVSKPLYRLLTAEVSVLEWLQFACLVGATVVFGLLGVRLAFAYRSFRFIFMPEAGQRITTFGELPELALYFAALMVGIVALREVERAARSVRHSALQPIGR